MVHKIDISGMNKTCNQWEYGLYTYAENPECPETSTLHYCHLIHSVSANANCQLICECPDPENCLLMFIRKTKFESEGNLFEICEMQEYNELLNGDIKWLYCGIIESRLLSVNVWILWTVISCFYTHSEKRAILAPSDKKHKRTLRSPFWPSP